MKELGKDLWPWRLGSHGYISKRSFKRWAEKKDQEGNEGSGWYSDNSIRCRWIASDLTMEERRDWVTPSLWWSYSFMHSLRYSKHSSVVLNNFTSQWLYKGNRLKGNTTTFSIFNSAKLKVIWMNILNEGTWACWKGSTVENHSTGRCEGKGTTTKSLRVRDPEYRQLTVR